MISDEYSDKIKNIFSEEETVDIDIPEFITDEKHDIIKEFIKYTKQHLQLEDLPEISFTEDRSVAPGMTTGAFLPETSQLYIYVNGRALCDYLRTLAHELVHYKQRENGEIPPDLQGRDTELEAEANTVAGDIVYEFAHMNEENQKIYEL